MLEGTAHRVLTADCGQTESKLRLVCAEESRKRLAPTLGLSLRSLEVFLEGQAALVVAAARRDNLCHALDNRADCPVIRRLLRNRGVKAPSHNRSRGCFAVEHGELRRHRLNGRLLITSRKRHKNRTRADCAVEALYQTSLRANIQIGDELFPIRCGVFEARGVAYVDVGNAYGRVLFRTV